MNDFHLTELHVHLPVLFVVVAVGIALVNNKTRAAINDPSRRKPTMQEKKHNKQHSRLQQEQHLRLSIIS